MDIIDDMNGSRCPNRSIDMCIGRSGFNWSVAGLLPPTVNICKNCSNFGLATAHLDPFRTINSAKRTRATNSSCSCLIGHVFVGWQAEE